MQLGSLFQVASLALWQKENQCHGHGFPHPLSLSFMLASGSGYYERLWRPWKFQTKILNFQDGGRVVVDILSVHEFWVKWWLVCVTFLCDQVVFLLENERFLYQSQKGIELKTRAINQITTSQLRLQNTPHPCNLQLDKLGSPLELMLVREIQVRGYRISEVTEGLIVRVSGFANQKKDWWWMQFEGLHRGWSKQRSLCDCEFHLSVTVFVLVTCHPSCLV